MAKRYELSDGEYAVIADLFPRVLERLHLRLDAGCHWRVASVNSDTRPASKQAGRRCAVIAILKSFKQGRSLLDTRSTIIRAPLFERSLAKYVTTESTEPTEERIESSLTRHLLKFPP